MGRLIVWRATTEINNAESREPGRVEYDKARNALVVAAGQGTLLLVHELQLEGKKRLNVRDFLNGVRLNPEDRFGAD